MSEITQRAAADVAAAQQQSETYAAIFAVLAAQQAAPAPHQCQHAAPVPARSTGQVVAVAGAAVVGTVAVLGTVVATLLSLAVVAVAVGAVSLAMAVLGLVVLVLVKEVRK